MKHGYATYSQGLCKCAVCMQAKRDYMRDQRASRNGLPPGDPRHGYSGAQNWRCKCDICREARRVRDREVRDRKRLT